MKTFYDFIRRTSGKLNEAAGHEYDLTKEEDIFFTSTIAEDGNKYYQLRKLKNGKLTTSAIVDIGVKDAALGIYYVLTYSGSKYLFDVHNLDEDSGIDGKPPIGSRLKLMWKEIKDVAKQQQQQTPEPAAPAANTPRAILGVSEDASEAQIKLAYRKLAFQFHPDRNPGDETAAAKFRQVQDAYDELRKPPQQQQQITIEEYKELFKGMLIRTQGILEMAMKEAAEEINNPEQPMIKRLTDDEKKIYLQVISEAPNSKNEIEQNIDNIGDAQANAYGKLLVDALKVKDGPKMIYICSEILIIVLWPKFKYYSKKQGESQQQGAPNQQQPQQQFTIEQYKELIQHIMEIQFESSMQKAIDEINNPTHEEIKNMPENDKKEFIEFVLTAPSYKRRIIEHDIGKLNDNIISHFGPLIKKAIDPPNYNIDDIRSICCTILMMILGQIKEQQEKQQQQEDSQEHLLKLARQLNNPKIRKGLVYMINGNPGRVSVWAAEIKTPQDLQKKYEDWVRRGLVE